MTAAAGRFRPKTLLVQPNSFDPIGLKYLAKHLMDSGFQAEVVMYGCGDSFDEKLKEYDPDF